MAPVGLVASDGSTIVTTTATKKSKQHQCSLLPDSFFSQTTCHPHGLPLLLPLGDDMVRANALLSTLFTGVAFLLGLYATYRWLFGVRALVGKEKDD